LTSGETFSAAEAFAYDLSNRGRAVLVGEATRGGAHFVEEFRIHDHFSAWVPIGRAVSPVTGANWEGTGIKPDIEASAAEALRRAHREALQKLLAEAVDERRKEELRQALESL
jgi:C-terminal processing protease CtpA/Prc